MKVRHAKKDEGIEQLLKAAAKSLAIISSRGQLTVPHAVRELCKISEGTIVAFEPQREGVLLKPLKVIAEDPYDPKEWERIEKLRKEKGIGFTSADEAVEHIDNL